MTAHAASGLFAVSLCSPGRLQPAARCLFKQPGAGRWWRCGAGTRICVHAAPRACCPATLPYWAADTEFNTCVLKSGCAATKVVRACAPRTASWACTQPRVVMPSSAALDSGGAPVAAPPAPALEPAPQQSCAVGATVRWAPLATSLGTPPRTPPGCAVPLKCVAASGVTVAKSAGIVHVEVQGAARVASRTPGACSRACPTDKW